MKVVGLNPEFLLKNNFYFTTFNFFFRQTATVMNNDDDDGVEEKITDAYMKTFDLLDIDQDGCLDQEELMKWLTMFGAEINVTSIVEVLTQEGNLSREKFGSLMASYASSNRRDYDITGTIKGHS